jgi:hypothetical protein
LYKFAFYLRVRASYLQVADLDALLPLSECFGIVVFRRWLGQNGLGISFRNVPILFRNYFGCNSFELSDLRMLVPKLGPAFFIFGTGPFASWILGL